MSTALIIGAAAIGAFFVLRAANSSAAAPAAPAKPPCGVPISSHGTTVTIPCSALKAVATAPVNVTRGVVGAIVGSNPKVSLFGNATGAVAGPLKVTRAVA
jgi:hypothetical protein